MNTRLMNILAGVLFMLAGAVTLIDGVYNMRASNLCVGIAFVVVGSLYLRGRKERG